jgi:hypothetical protein
MIAGAVFDRLARHEKSARLLVANGAHLYSGSATDIELQAGICENSSHRYVAV